MDFDDELLAEFVIEANEHLADVENQFLSIEESGAEINVDLVNEVFRAIHSIKGAAGFLGMTKVNDLAHSLENLLNMMRNEELVPTSAIIDVMLRAADKLQGMINDLQNSNEVDVSDHIAALEKIAEQEQTKGDETSESETETTTVDEQPTPLSTPVEETASESPPAEKEDTKAPAVDAPVADESPAVATAAPEEPAQVVAPAPKAEKKTEKKSASSSSTSATAPEANIRVPVGVLDKLMNLAGELVLSRNQLLQAIASDEQSSLDTIATRLDQVTSEVQESIMQTRMQQIGTVFGRFPRVVRDLSSKLNKHCDLNIEGKEVEVDKTIIEAIGDPMTHLVRNSIDHGVETPDVRKKAGKRETGTMNLRACYQAGKVRIEIEDDGAGINPKILKKKALEKGIITADQAEQMSDREAIRLIFHPGFSMAEKVTDVSGRGVGMDVVRTNISKLGGTIDVESEIGVGTSIIITLPLTLAIIPSLIIQSGDDRFAIPQVNIAELVRVREQDLEKRLGRVKDAEVLRLRGNLLPLVRLKKSLGISKPDSVLKKEQPEVDAHHEETASATNIIVVETGQQQFGLVVDSLHESEEIVVKPLGRNLQGCPCLSGATILGDGHVALILDVAGIATFENIRSGGDPNESEDHTESSDAQEQQTVLLFSNHESEHFAVAMDVVSRIESIRTEQIDSVGGHEMLQYRSSTMPLLRLENCITAKPIEPGRNVYVIVFEVGGNEVGLIAPRLDDIRDVPTDVDTSTFCEQGVIGSLVIDEKTTRLVDIFLLAEIIHPDWFVDHPIAVDEKEGPPIILLAEDSTFFRKQVKEMMASKGYEVVDFEDGLLAWEAMISGEYEIDLVVTDIEMPNMDGFQLCQRIKNSDQWKHVPVIALTSLASTANIEHGMEVGIDDYQIKMDRDKLLTALQNFTGGKAGSNRRELQTVS